MDRKSCDYAINRMNHQILQMMSNYLNQAADYIKEEVVDEIVEECHVTNEYAFCTLLAAACGLDAIDCEYDNTMFHHYLLKMVKQLDIDTFINNPYYKNIHLTKVSIGDCELTEESYAAYEAFVRNDIVEDEEGRLLPQIGYFSKPFFFPAILEHGRVWMTITPNEIATMEEPIADANGNVLVFGIGLGYYAYMVSEKSNVTSITLVDQNKDVIQLFRQYILPQFQHKNKINIVHADAFEYAKEHLDQFHYIFTDLWHDVSDGIPLYRKMKEYEHLNPTAQYGYWIEKSMKLYM